ncbi:hypothetical protein NA57DRAFT_55943 [Rhizodiscina lignyota]|uniref:RINT-1 family protein n=1 Tax=Rhizodiscina lignyota TaxID=1504668 RepID=A0A9P4IDU4_9PEZI|nr:hypothetical protein NA57DRAFT_55943 [Rhizodiscina lignyota]
MPAALVERPGARDARVGDYLDDKLQTTADLQDLDDLISSVGQQHELLKRQLVDAEKDLNGAKTAYQKHSTSIQARGEQFIRDQDGIDRRLQIITQSETSDEAVRKFEASMDKLRQLDITAGYVELLKEVDSLNNESLSKLGTADAASLDAYRRLQTLKTSLGPLQDAAEGAAPHLLDHISNVTRTLHDRIRSAFSAQMESVLKKVYWPREDASIPPGLQQQWNDSVSKLLELQMPELEAAEAAADEARNAGAATARGEGPRGLLPMQVLVHSLELKFRYHFEGDKPTNRLDRPEYFLQFATENILSTYNGFITEFVQPILLRKLRGRVGMNPVYIDATSAFITAILPMVRTKIFSVIPRVQNQPQLLSHTIHEIMKFDSTIREEWGYDGGYGEDGWKGLVWEVLVLKDWFPKWLQVEKDFALARYQTIIDDPFTGELDFDSLGQGETKPTKAAIRVNDLLETITDRYRDLPSFTQKLRFLIDIQISIFDRFHSRLHGSLEAYLTMTSSLGRTVQGISREEQEKLQGVAGLDRLCRVYGSAEYLERMMRDWSDDVFFLDLYTELQDRAKNRHRRGQASRAFAGDLSVSQVAERTSAAVVSEDGGDGGALFDETAAAYSRLRVRSEGIIVDVLQHNVREALRGYRSINPWASLSSSASGQSSTTPELQPLLEHLSSSLVFLHRALGIAPLRRIARQMLFAVDESIFHHVLFRRNFSTQGANQLKMDVTAIVGVVERSLGGDRGVDVLVESGLGRLLEAVRLVGLPVRGGGTFAETVVEEEDVMSEDGRSGLGLWQVEKRLFADNESARGVLEELGMGRLSEQEARGVLERRVELGG